MMYMNHETSRYRGWDLIVEDLAGEYHWEVVLYCPETDLEISHSGMVLYDREAAIQDAKSVIDRHHSAFSSK